MSKENVLYGTVESPSQASSNAQRLYEGFIEGQMALINAKRDLETANKLLEVRITELRAALSRWKNAFFFVLAILLIIIAGYVLVHHFV
jgi:t-SNARE complex subunit (syntaxin)